MKIVSKNVHLQTIKIHKNYMYEKYLYSILAIDIDNKRVCYY